MQTLLQDLRYGMRILAKTPGVVILIVLTLSLGIGGSTLLFNMVRQWGLNPVSFPHADRLAVLWVIAPPHEARLALAWENDHKKARINQASTPDYSDWRDQNSVFENLAAWSTTNFN